MSVKKYTKIKYFLFTVTVKKYRKIFKDYANN